MADRTSALLASSLERSRSYSPDILLMASASLSMVCVALACTISPSAARTLVVRLMTFWSCCEPSNSTTTSPFFTGRPVKKGDVVVEFDGSQQDQNVISRTTNVRAADGDIVQAKATQTIDNEADAMSKMSGEYDLERSKLDASKAEVLSAIDGEKNRIQVGVSEGSLQTVKASINAHQVGQQADLSRLSQAKDKAVRDLNTAQSYLGMMQLRAPNDGIVNVLSNFRSSGSFGQATPPFKEGDNAWTGAEIAEIPDLSEMYVDLKLEEVDRGKLKLGQ